MRENTNQKNFKYGHLLRSETLQNNSANHLLLNHILIRSRSLFITLAKIFNGSEHASEQHMFWLTILQAFRKAIQVSLDISITRNVGLSGYNLFVEFEVFQLRLYRKSTKN